MAAVYDSINSTLTRYTNGVQVVGDPVVLDTAPLAALNSAHLGAWLGIDGNLYRFFDGQIDEVAVFSSALSSNRIAAHYQAAAIAVVGPALSYSLAAGQLTLSWNGTGFVLQENSNLNNSSGWTDLPSGDLSPVSVNVGTGSAFFRLEKQ